MGESAQFRSRRAYFDTCETNANGVQADVDPLRCLINCRHLPFYLDSRKKVDTLLSSSSHTISIGFLLVEDDFT